VNRIESLNDISVNQCHREAVDVGAERARGTAFRGT